MLEVIAGMMTALVAPRYIYRALSARATTPAGRRLLDIRPPDTQFDGAADLARHAVGHVPLRHRTAEHAAATAPAGRRRRVPVTFGTHHGPSAVATPLLHNRWSTRIPGKKPEP
jgi:hypothetical protein